MLNLQRTLLLLNKTAARCKEGSLHWICFHGLCPTDVSVLDAKIWNWLVVPVSLWIFNLRVSSQSLPLQYLKQPDEEHSEADGLHDVGVVVQQGLSTASPPQVQLLALLVIVEVGWAVADLVLDAGSRWESVAAAEGNSVYQILSLHITPQTATREEQVVSGTGTRTNSTTDTVACRQWKHTASPVVCDFGLNIKDYMLLKRLLSKI